MKKTLLFAILLLLQISLLQAQTNYTTTYTSNIGNPGGVNTENDDVVAGWSSVLTAPLSINQWSAPVAIPFVFNFYGQPVTSLRASANGLVTFSAASTLLPNNNQNLPTSALPDSTIACFWDAFTNLPPTGGNDSVVSKVFGTTPNRQFWIKWVSFEMGSPATIITMSCVLEETTNKIYLVESNGGANPLLSQTVGLQLSASKAMQEGNSFRPQTNNTSATSNTDNDFFTFTPFAETNMQYASSTTVQPVPSFVAKNNNNEAILRVQVQTTGELLPINATQFNFNTNGTTNVADISNARLFYTGTDSAFNTNNQFGTSINLPNGAFSVVGSQALQKGTNYFWLTYSIPNTATNSDTIDAECTQITVAGNTQIPTITAPVGQRIINSGLSGTITVGAGSTYTYLSDAFNAVNTIGLSGNTVLSITSDIDDIATASLNYTSGNNYKISIVPSADVLRNITARFTSSYITLDGTKNLVIDGKGPISGTGKFLRFVNRTDSGATFTFVNGARYDTIRNAIVEGACSSPLRGVITLGSSVNATAGNRDLWFANNDVRDRSDSVGIPANLFYSSNTNVALLNSNILIGANNIFNFRRAGILVTNTGNGGNWRFLDNSFYYNASSNPTGGDILPILFTPGQAADDNKIHGNFIGGSQPLCGGSPWISPNAVNWVAMNISAGVGVGTSIQANTIQNISLTTTGTVDFAGIRLDGGRMFVGDVIGNTIGHASIANSIANAAKLTLCIYAFTNNNTEMTIANNTIANITATGTTTTSGVRGISIQGGAANVIIRQNTIYNLSSTAINTSPLTAGILGIGINGNDADNHILQNNVVYNLNTTATSANVVPTGIVFDGAGANIIIEGNRISRITNISTGATALIHGIHLAGGLKGNSIVRNNFISLTNGTNANAMLIRGISDNTAANAYQFYNNTIFIGGSALSGAANSFAFDRRNTSTILLRNNILYNKRTGGTGIHAAIAATNATPLTNWNQNVSDYNLLVSASAAQVGCWIAVPQTFTAWQTIALGADRRSWSDVVANVPANLFIDTLTADLRIDSTSSNCWYAKGKGIALANVPADIHGQTRPTTIAQNVGDIGADAFSTVTIPAPLTQTGNIATNDSTTLSFAGRTLGKVFWMGGTQYPSSITAQYYSAIPNINIVGDRFNAYYTFAQTGGTGFDATIQLAYDSAIMGTVSNPANIQMIFGSNPNNWSHLTLSAVNTSNSTFVSSLLSQGVFVNSFTGTSSNNPVPVKLVQFHAQYAKSTKSVQLFWSTANEINSSYFEVERSVNGRDFKPMGRVNAAGNSNKTITYKLNDDNLPIHNKIYYRLKIMDIDGQFTYSKVVEVNLLDETKVKQVLSVYPNPVASELNIALAPSINPINVKVYNKLGVLESENTISETLNEQLHTLNINGGAGLYFVVVSSGNIAETIKVIKQ